MLFVKKLPWISLLLLVFTYAVFGWLISATDFSWIVWGVAAVYTLLIAFVLTAPLRLMKSFYTSWLQSDVRAFMSVIFAAFVAVIILCAFRIFIRIVVLIAAGALVRLDLQTAGYREWQAFGILAVFSLAGFSLGIVVHQML